MFNYNNYIKEQLETQLLGDSVKFYKTIPKIESSMPEEHIKIPVCAEWQLMSENGYGVAILVEIKVDGQIISQRLHGRFQPNIKQSIEKSNGERHLVTDHDKVHDEIRFLCREMEVALLKNLANYKIEMMEKYRADKYNEFG